MSFLSEVEKKLDLPPGEKAQVLKELESHYREVEEELIAAGNDEGDATTEAARRLGDPQDVASRLQTVHCQATWRTAWLTVLPFLGLILNLPVRMLTGAQAKETNPFLVYAFGVAIAAFAATMITGSIRELRAVRRPAWLATWLAVGVTMLVSTIRFFGYRAFGLMIGAEHTDFHYRVWNSSTQLLVIVPLALWASRGSTKCTMFVVGVVALAIALTAQNMSIPLGQQKLLVVLCVALAPSALLMLVALRLFSFHPYGTVCQASLFLLAAYGYRILDHNAPTIAVLAVPAAETLLAAIVAWIAVRACTQRHKLSILAWGVFMVGVGGSLVQGWVSYSGGIELPGFPLDTNWIVNGIGMGVFQGSFYSTWIVFFPVLLSERWFWRMRPEVRLTIER